METKQIITAIKDYNPFCEHITLSTIYAKMRVPGTFHVISFGKPGTGKSRSSKTLLEQLDLGTEIILESNTTRRGLFEAIKDYAEQDIILDECALLFKERGAQEMLKLLMEAKVLTWTKKGSYETAGPYTRNIIANVNVPVDDALVDRAFFNKVIMNREMALAFNEYYMKRNTDDGKELIKYLRKVLKNEKEVVLSQEEVRYVHGFAQKHINESDKDLGYSRRSIIRMLEYFKRTKKLFGRLDDEVKAFIEPIAELYVINDRTPSLIEAIVQNGPIDKAELIRKVAKEGGYSERHSRKLVADAIASKEIVLKGRMVMVNG